MIKTVDPSVAGSNTFAASALAETPAVPTITFQFDLALNATLNISHNYPIHGFEEW